MSEPIVFTNPWQINELSDALTNDLTFGKIETDSPDRIEVVNDIVTDVQLQAIIESGKLVGDYRRIEWLYLSSSSNISFFINRYAPRSNGEIQLPEDNLKLFYIMADAQFRSIVTATKKYLDDTQSIIKKYGGEKSDCYRRWTGVTANAYDSSLVYALMYDLRNRLEHEFWTISLVNLDIKHHKAGLVINIDNDLMNIELKSALKSRLKDWAARRIEKGETAWLSLGECVRTYKSMIQALYVIWLDALLGMLDQAIEENREVLTELPGNILIWSSDKTRSHSATGQPRAYRIPNIEIVQSIRHQQEATLMALEEIVY